MALPALLYGLLLNIAQRVLCIMSVEYAHARLLAQDCCKHAARHVHAARHAHAPRADLGASCAEHLEFVAVWKVTHGHSASWRTTRTLHCAVQLSFHVISCTASA